jgi:hypothetical protein
MTTINDLVLIYFEDKPFSFARVEEILPDAKKGWYHITLLLLQIPIQTVTWILRDVYINGGEFTMDGKRMRIEKLAARKETPLTAPEAPQKPKKPDSGSPKAGTGKVVSLSDRKPKK